MSFTIYTISDPAVLGAAFNGLSLFFGQDSWVEGIIKTALLFSLLFVLAKGVIYNGGIRMDILLLQMIIVWAAFLPKTTVVLEQFENAAPPVVVDGIPYAVALPAALAGSFSMYMTNKIQIAMSTVDGNYMSVSGAEHPFNPAKILMSVAVCPNDPMSCFDQNLAETMRSAARYCSGGELSNTNFQSAPSVIGALAQSIPASNYTKQTVIYDAAHPFTTAGMSGAPATCETAKTYLTNLSDAIASGQLSVFEPIFIQKANAATSNRYRANDQSMSVADSLDAQAALELMQKATDDIGRLDYVALTNVMTYKIAEAVKYNASAPIDQQISIVRDQGLFAWAKDESMTAIMVASVAPKFMDILFFIFVAATPLVMFVVLANPQAGLKTAGSYVLFGVWTQSWIPMMAIVMFWYQNEIQMFKPPMAGLTASSVEYVAALMKHVMVSTIAASDMLQKAPYITFAILAGSMFALSNMVSGASKSLESDMRNAGGEGKSAGGSSKGDINESTQGRLAKLKQGQALFTNGTGIGGGQVTGDVMSSLGSIGGTSIDTSASVSKGLNYANEKAKRLEAATAQTFTEGWRSLMGTSTSGGEVDTSSSGVDGSNGSSGSTKQSSSNQYKDSQSGSTSVEASGTSSKGSDWAVKVQAQASADLFGAYGSLINKLGKSGNKALSGKLQAEQDRIAQQLNSGQITPQQATQELIKAAAQHGQGESLASEFEGKGKEKSPYQARLEFDASAGLGARDSNDLKASQANRQEGSTEKSSGESSEFGANANYSFGASSKSGHVYQQLGQLIREAAKGYEAAKSLRDVATEGETAIRSMASNNTGSVGTKTTLADTATKYGQMMAASSMGASTSMGMALSRLLPQVNTFSGAQKAEFQQAAESYAADLNKNHSATMNKDQMAAAAAFLAFRDMTNKGDPSTTGASLSGLSRLTELAGMPSGSGQMGEWGLKLDDAVRKTEKRQSDAAGAVEGVIAPAASAAPAIKGGIEAASEGRIVGAGAGIKDDEMLARSFSEDAQIHKPKEQAKGYTGTPSALNNDQAALLKEGQDNSSFFLGAGRFDPNGDQSTVQRIITAATQVPGVSSVINSLPPEVQQALGTGSTATPTPSTPVTSATGGTGSTATPTPSTPVTPATGGTGSTAAPGLPSIGIGNQGGSTQTVVMTSPAAGASPQANGSNPKGNTPNRKAPVMPGRK